MKGLGFWVKGFGLWASGIGFREPHAGDRAGLQAGLPARQAQAESAVVTITPRLPAHFAPLRTWPWPWPGPWPLALALTWLVWQWPGLLAHRPHSVLCSLALPPWPCPFAPTQLSALLAPGPCLPGLSPFAPTQVVRIAFALCSGPVSLATAPLRQPKLSTHVWRSQKGVSADPCGAL